MPSPAKICHLFRLQLSEKSLPDHLDSSIQTLERHARTCPACHAWILEKALDDPRYLLWISQEPPITFNPSKFIQRKRARRWIPVAVAASVVAVLAITLITPKVGHRTPTIPVSQTARSTSYKPEPIQPPLVENVPPEASVYTFEIDGTPVVLFYTGVDTT